MLNMATKVGAGYLYLVTLIVKYKKNIKIEILFNDSLIFPGSSWLIHVCLEKILVDISDIINTVPSCLEIRSMNLRL